MTAVHTLPVPIVSPMRPLCSRFMRFMISVMPDAPLLSDPLQCMDDVVMNCHVTHPPDFAGVADEWTIRGRGSTYRRWATSVNRVPSAPAGIRFSNAEIFRLQVNSRASVSSPPSPKSPIMRAVA